MKQWAYRIGLETLRATGLYRLPGLADRGHGVVLTLHHVNDAPVPAFAPNRGLTITPDFLGRAIERLRALDYEIVPLDEVARRIEAPDPSRRFAAFTLDDGYRDNMEQALPVFRRHGVPCTVFVPTGFVEHRVVMWWAVLEDILTGRDSIVFDFGQGPETIPTATTAAKERVWQRFSIWVTRTDPYLVLDRISELARASGIDPLERTRREIMSLEELKAFAADPLVSIGGHTITHPNLANLGEDAVRDEIVGGLDKLEAWLGKRPRHFAYPYGFPDAAGPEQFRIVRDLGLELAFTTRPGVIYAEHAGYRTALPRISLNGYFQCPNQFEVLLSGVPFYLRNGFSRLDVA